jgi:hypothetical protein
MTTQHRNHAKNIYSSLEHLNEAVAPTHRYAIRRQDGQYILVTRQGAEYPPRSAYEMRQTLLSMTLYAKGRT